MPNPITPSTSGFDKIKSLNINHLKSKIEENSGTYRDAVFYLGINSHLQELKTGEFSVPRKPRMN